MNNLQIKQGTNEAWFVYDGNKVLLGSHDRSLIEKVCTIIKRLLKVEKNTMTKKEILQNIADCFDKEKNNKARNSMGVSESNYNPFFLIGNCFTTEELSEMSELELNNLIKFADYVSDVFY